MGADVEADVKRDGDGVEDEQSEYTCDERVLAYHAGFIYEAKVLKTKNEDDEWKYFIHYLGWKKSWDEWVARDRLLKHNEENLEKQRELLKEHEEGRKGSGSASKKSPSQGSKGARPPRITQVKSPRATPKTKASKDEKEVDEQPEESSGSVNRSSKRKANDDEMSTTSNGDAPGKQAVEIPMPVSLKKQLVEDERFVCYQGQLVKLPRKPNVGELLESFVESKRKKDGRVNEALAEIMKGLRSYFDRALPAMLLYKNERQQFNDTLPPDSVMRPSEVYGAEHLLRLFTKLPELLGYVSMEEETVEQLRTHLSDFMKYMQKNQSSILLSSYDGPRVEPRFESPLTENKKEKKIKS